MEKAYNNISIRRNAQEYLAFRRFFFRLQK